MPRERTVDAAFLADIEDDRVSLARDLVRENGRFPWNDVALNEVIQRILDRILFLRFCEDREIDTGVSLERIVEDWRENNHRGALYPKLVSHFRGLDAVFNGALFRRGHESEKVTVSDEFLTEIIERLSSEDSPYLFNTLPVEILGSVYERFLGKVVHVTKTGITVKEKPERRKAGGIYYTPRYIVNYVVEQTVGNLVRGKSPTQLEKITVLDPACGSGSFLIGAFERICEEYLRWYHANPKQQKERLCYTDADGNLHLTTHLKRQIMLHSIYGVDLDPQAVEVTMLSLYLKILEGETKASIIRQQELFPHEALLPDLSRNIRIGNSLIESDYLDLFPDEEERKTVRPFDWEAAFPGLIRGGGFDAVIGNPPYYNVDTLGKRSPQMAYLRRHYAAVWNDKTDILNYFLYRATTLSKMKVGMIVSRAFLEAYKSDRLRDALRKSTEIQNIVDFGDFHVFQAGITTAIIVLEKKTPDSAASVAVRRINGSNPTEAAVIESLVGSQKDGVFESFKVRQSTLTADAWNLSSRAVQSIYKKIDRSTTSLGDLFDIGQGMQTGCNEVFGGLALADVKKLRLGTKLSRKRAANSDIDRYCIRDRREYLLWVEDVSEFKTLPTQARKYLSNNKRKLTKRAAYKRKNCEWWKFTWPLHKSFYSKDKIIAPFLAPNNRFALDKSRRFIGLTDTIVLFKREDVEEDVLYFLALLNSRLLDFRFKGIAKLKGGGIYEYFWNSVSKIPIRRIDFDDKGEVAKHDKLVRLASRMMELVSELQGARSDAERESIQNTIHATDQKVDALVFDLYNIAGADLEAIEGRSAVIPEEKRPDEEAASAVAPARARRTSQKKNEMQPNLFG